MPNARLAAVASTKAAREAGHELVRIDEGSHIRPDLN